MFSFSNFLSMKNLFISVVFIFFHVLSFAQVGIIRGKVMDKESGEPLIGVAIEVMNLGTGTITDFDGDFELNLNPGKYDLNFTYLGYSSIIITEVVVISEEVNYLEIIELSEESEQLDEIVITAEAIKSSESGVLQLKRKSINLVDGLSSVTFRKIGDGNAAAAVKRITGVSVEGGKYVYVRGLGDRYTSVTLNEITIPGLDPDRNSLQLDIFPTNVIGNVTVVKSASAEYKAEFTGGLVNIETKEFPETKIFEISAGFDFNPAMHFNQQFLTYPGGKFDFLGFDDGTRALQTGIDVVNIPTPVSGASKEQVNRFVKNFDPVLGTQKMTSPVDFDLGISVGNQKTLASNKKIGYIFSATYRRNYTHYDNVNYSEFQRLIDPTEYNFRYATIQEGVLYKINSFWGTLAGIAYKGQNSKLKFNFLHLQNGESSAGNFDIDNDGEAVGQSGYFAYSNNLEYNQRGLTNILINGQHSLKNDSWNIDWRISPTISNLVDPDIRRTVFTVEPAKINFTAGAGGNPNRIWRYLDEINVDSKIDLVKKIGDSKLKFGLSYVFKERDYKILSFDMQFFGMQENFNGDPNFVLTDQNIYPNGSVYFSSGNNSPNPNEYNSTVGNFAGYISGEFTLWGKLKTVAGLRAEKFVQRHTGRDVEYANFGTGNNLVNEKVLDALDLFPSTNFIFPLDDKTNLRFSYSRTIARPSFKELSFAQILDPITNRIFNGGLFQYGDWDGNLTETRIHNIDLRWEYFMEKNQILSFSGFFKSFDNPIELVRIPEQQTSTEFQPRNVGDGRLFGVELEFIKNLEFLSPSLTNFKISGNFSYIESKIEMTNREFNARKNYEKVGQTVTNDREMAGQAPYLINFGLGYENQEKVFDAGIFYNVRGSTLAIVGVGLYADVYAQPFHSLNFNLNAGLGKDKRVVLNAGIVNILNDTLDEVYKGFEAQNEFFTSFNPGRTFKMGIKYSIR
ncbi:MAG: hypothetical protein RJA52_845 [Bacteroidota bacterium]